MKNVSNWISCRCFKSGPLKQYKVITINMRENTDHENELVWKRDTFGLGLSPQSLEDHWWSRKHKNGIFSETAEHVINWGRGINSWWACTDTSSTMWQTQYAMKDYYRHNYLMEITIHVFMFSLRAGALRTYIIHIDASVTLYYNKTSNILMVNLFNWSGVPITFRTWFS